MSGLGGFNWAENHKLEKPKHRLPKDFGFELSSANKGIRAIRVYLWWPSHVDPAFNQPSAISSMPFKDREPTEIYVLPLVSVEWSQFFLTINPRVQNINNLIAAADRQSLERARDLTDNMAADCQFLHHKCMQRHDPPPVNEDAGQQAAQPRRIAWMEKNFLYRFALNELRMTSQAIRTHLKYLRDYEAEQWDLLKPVRNLFVPSEPHYDNRGHVHT